MRRLRLAAIALVPLLAGGFLLQSRATANSARLFDQVLGVVSDRFVDTLATGQLYEKAAKGLVKELNDPYTVLLSPKELASFTRTTSGRYGGVGMQIEEQQGWVTVSRVFPHTPAEAAGIREGDRIVQIDTQSARGWKIDQVSNTLLGTPGTKVSVRFARPGVPEPINVRFTRAVIHIPAVPYALMLEGKVGYVPLQQFNETASDEVEEALERLGAQGARAFILDLRGNPGGYFEQSHAVSNLFLRQGQEIVSSRGRNTPTQTYAALAKPLVPSAPLVVLVDGGSASASEIVAGALQDHDRALIVGMTSFGKGLVQSVFPLDGGYALKMTTMKYYTPTGRSIQRERKLLPTGEFVEVLPDSLETDSARKARPVYKTNAGRTVYGGGGIAPDILVKPDTLTTAEQTLAKALAPKAQDVYVTLSDYALELKNQVKSADFPVTSAHRDEFYTRLRKKGVALERTTYDSGAAYIDRVIGQRVARLAFGDSAAKRREMPDDVQLLKAIDVLKRGQTQKDLFVIASREQPALPTATDKTAQKTDAARP